MLVAETAVSGDIGVPYPPVQAGAHLQAARPVLGDEGRVESSEVGVRHGHDPTLRDRRPAALPVGDPEVPSEDAPAEVEFLHVVGDRHRVDVAPVPAVDPDCQRLPVGQVDDALVLDVMAVDVGGEPVENAGSVGTRIVHLVGALLRSGATGGEAAVPQRAQCLAQRLFLGVVALVPYDPASHRDRRLRGPMPTRVDQRTAGSDYTSLCASYTSSPTSPYSARSILPQTGPNDPADTGGCRIVLRVRAAATASPAFPAPRTRQPGGMAPRDLVDEPRCGEDHHAAGRRRR